MITRTPRRPSPAIRRGRPALVAAGLALVPVLAEENGFEDLVQPAFRQNCVKCHGEKDKVKGKVNLLELRTAADLLGKPDLLEELLDVLDLEEMPPEDEPQLDPETRAALVAHLKTMLEEALDTGGGLLRTPIRRMNRFQYNNAVQDLFGLKVVVFTLPERMLRDHDTYFRPETGKMPGTLKAGSRPLGKSQLIEKRLAGVAAFPQDLRAEHGFDNRGDHLSLSPLLLDSFLKLSRSIAESPDFNPKTCGIWQEFFAPPSDEAGMEAAVRERLRGFLTRAFRRPVEDGVLDRYVAHVLARMEAGGPFTESMKEAASAALASPQFLYLYERGGTSDGAEALDDFELASRLSFFLWGSIPDRELIDAAALGTLREPEVLGAQVDRMLDDRKMKRFCDSFPSQWLQLERIISSTPDPDRHPGFYFAKYRVSMHMMLEPLLLFETVLVENRSILELIDSDFSYRSELLKAWYRDGGKSVRKKPSTVIPFRRVSVTDRREGGVITNAAVMTMTSNPTRTQPITRGAWLASVIFNDPPEPPPANVPALPEDDAGSGKDLTLRERLDAHRDRPDCKGCHAQIDPLGFALENYGPTGLWRDAYENGRAVDNAGVLFRRHKFGTVVEFKDAILAEKGRFARGFTEHLLSFALGRKTGPADSLAIDRILRETEASNFPLRAMIRRIVLSDPFLKKYTPVAPGDSLPDKPTP